MVGGRSYWNQFETQQGKSDLSDVCDILSILWLDFLPTCATKEDKTSGATFRKIRQRTHLNHE